MPGIVKICAKELYDICQKNAIIDKDITYKEFYDVTREFNKMMSDEINKGYQFDTIIGEFGVVKKDRVRRYIDWGSSNKKKMQLIEEGKIPFNKKTAPEGEDWLIYFTSTVNFTWKWIQAASVKTFYYFMPCTDNKRKLGREVKRRIANQIEDYATFKNGVKSVHSF